MAEARFLSYRDITDPTAKMYHPCYFAEDLAKAEMDALCEIMEKHWGFDEDVPDVGYEFRVEPSARENLAEFAHFSEFWHSYLEGGPGDPFYHHTHELHVWASKYADHIRLARRRMPQGAYLLADFGGGEGQVFNYVDSLNARELEILASLLAREIHERGGIFDMACVADLVVDDPAQYIRLKREWEWFREEELQQDRDDVLVRANNVSENLIEEIHEWRATTAATELEEMSTSHPNTIQEENTEPQEGGNDSGPASASEEDGRGADVIFIPTPLQKAILAALAGQALKKQALADLICKGEGTVLYREGGIKELRAMGLVEHKSRIGFFRPDAPPEGAIMPDETVPKVSPE